MEEGPAPPILSPSRCSPSHSSRLGIRPLGGGKDATGAVTRVSGKSTRLLGPSGVFALTGKEEVTFLSVVTVPDHEGSAGALRPRTRRSGRAPRVAPPSSFRGPRPTSMANGQMLEPRREQSGGCGSPVRTRRAERLTWKEGPRHSADDEDPLPPPDRLPRQSPSSPRYLLRRSPPGTGAGAGLGCRPVQELVSGRARGNGSERHGVALAAPPDAVRVSPAGLEPAPRSGRFLAQPLFSEFPRLQTSTYPSVRLLPVQPGSGDWVTWGWESGPFAPVWDNSGGMSERQNFPRDGLGSR